MQPVLRSRRRAVRVRRAPTSDARPTSALVDRAARSHRSRRAIDDRDRRSLFSLSLSLIWAFSSLSLSLFFRKSFEVKMRGETDFRVKGEKNGQPEVIFRKMIFFVTAKHVENGENDFLKSFSPKTNAP